MSRPTSRASWLAIPIAVLCAASAAAQQAPGTPSQAEIDARRREVGLPPGGQQPGPQPIIVQQMPAQPGPNLPPSAVLPTVELGQLLDRVARKSNKEFLMSFRASQQVFLGGADIDDVDYPMLLSILRNNSLAAFTAAGRVNVVPDGEIRAAPLPFVNTDDPKIADDEWVTRVITTNGEAAQLVPMLRPLLPQAAHLAATPPNKLIVIDRYANVRRITELVRLLDR